MRGGDLAVMVTVAVVLRVAAAWAIPLGYGESFNCAPDEAGHFWAARELALGHTATWPESLSIYSAYVPAPYALHAASYALLVPGLDRPWLYRMPLEAERVRGYPLVRLGSILLGALTVVALALATATWTGSRAAGLTAGALTALYPQLIFIGAYTNGDAYTVAAGAFLVLALASWARAGERSRGLIAVAASLGAVLVGKPSGYALLPPTAAWIAWALARRRVPRRVLVRALATTLAVAGPFLAWNALRNGGDVLGLGRYRQFLAGPYQPTTIASVPDPVVTFARLLASSAFGRFSNMSLPLDGPIYAAALVLLVAGTVASLTRVRDATSTTIRGALWLALSIVLGVVLVVFNSWSIDFQPQGRYVLLCALLWTIVASWGPVARGGAWRAWPVLTVVFLVLAALETERLLFAHPCG